MMSASRPCSGAGTPLRHCFSKSAQQHMNNARVLIVDHDPAGDELYRRALKRRTAGVGLRSRDRRCHRAPGRRVVRSARGQHCAAGRRRTQTARARPGPGQPLAGNPRRSTTHARKGHVRAEAGGRRLPGRHRGFRQSGCQRPAAVGRAPHRHRIRSAAPASGTTLQLRQYRRRLPGNAKSVRADPEGGGL